MSPVHAVETRESRTRSGGLRFRLSGGRHLLSVDDYRRAARRALPAMVWDYVDGGSDDLSTVRRNQEAFGEWELVPRVLVGVETVDTSATIGNVALDLPILLAPTGLSGLCNWQGEVAAARAAERVGTRAVVSTAASYSPEEIAAATTASHFFQLYPWASTDDGRELSASFIDRARDSRFSALVVTVDTATMGHREGEIRRGLGIPPTLTPGRIIEAAAHPRWTYGFLRHRRVSARLIEDRSGAAAGVRSVRTQLRMMRPDLRWEDLTWIRSRWEGPLFVKGVLDPVDARRAIELGADGVIVSNHGGRQLDTAQASLRALDRIAAYLGSAAPVLMDGGVRRGTDVVKALCLGARAVLIGRPQLYGLAVGGQAGVEGVLSLLRAELVRAMMLLGVRSVGELDRSRLVSL